MENQVEEQVEPNEAEPQEDLLTRVSQFQEENAVEVKSEEEVDQDLFSDPDLRKKIDTIEDPELKEYFQKLRKSGITGVNMKMQEIAEIRKELQSFKDSVNQPKWTPDRIKALETDPEFLEAAKQLGYASDEDDTDPAYAKLQKEIDDLKRLNQQTSVQQQEAQRQAEHQRLKQTYPDYNPQAMDTIYVEMLEGKRNSVTPGSSLLEDMYWAANGKTSVKKAYELGKKDALSGRESIPSSIEGVNTRPSENVKRDKEETSKSHLDRIIQNTLRNLKTKTSV